MEKGAKRDAVGRRDGRGPSELRALTFERHCVETAYGSCLVSMGRTRILCTASVVEDVPPFLKGKGSGWITAEYSMLPASTPNRTSRERNRGGPGGRTQEIQRLIGRSMRAIVDLKRLGLRTIWLDCDAIQSDGGTRTAAINGASVALHDALRRLVSERAIPDVPAMGLVGAVSVGILSNFPLLDLCYEEDFRADVDMNIVMAESGRFVEIQGTAEGESFSRDDLETFLDLGQAGIREIIRAQRECLDAG